MSQAMSVKKKKNSKNAASHPISSRHRRVNPSWSTALITRKSRAIRIKCKECDRFKEKERWYLKKKKSKSNSF